MATKKGSLNQEQTVLTTVTGSFQLLHVEEQLQTLPRTLNTRRAVPGLLTVEKARRPCTRGSSVEKKPELL